MEGKIEHRYNQEKCIFFKVYTGDISFENLITSWEEVIKNKRIPSGVKKFLIDYRKANILFDHKKAKDIADFYNRHNDIFGRSKITLVMIKPEHVIFPMIVESEGVNFDLKPFYTLEAATKWLSTD